MTVQYKRSATEQKQDIINDYKRQTGKIVLSMREVAAWAIERGRWQQSRRDIIKQCAHELARAAREEYYLDPQGRSVRKKHAVKSTVETENGPKQLVIWADIEDAPPLHMRLALQQRRRYILGDCRQLKLDMDSYNENNRHGAVVQMSLNFEEDLLEEALPTEYPEKKPD